jgi:integrase
MSRHHGNQDPDLSSAPARFLDQFEELRMDLSNEQLIAEAIEVNHANIGDKTRERYEDHLIHYSQYLASAHGKTFYTAQRKHVRLFMNHLAREGGRQPHRSRIPCEWCRVRGYPDGRSGPGWSASYRKSYLSAVKYLYKHFQAEEDLPDHNPAVLEIAPKVVYKRGYSLTKEEVRRLLDGEGTPKGRLLAHWTFYAPSRLKTFSDARWPEIDLDAATWEVVGKGGKVDVFALHPALVREFRAYRRWQLSEAQRNPAMRDALANPETAYVLLTKNGKRTHPNTVGKMLKRYAARNGVGVREVEKAWDMPKGVTSLVSPHAMRRTWATLALNDEDDPQPIDVVQEVLNHSDISTTRRHYAFTKPDRARRALKSMRV